MFLAQNAAAITVNPLGDFDNVTVMEVSGNYDAIDSYGRPDMSARREIAKEFYRSHGDDYDFLVIFTNFNFQMPSLQAKAFFSPAKNDVKGIGLELNDHTNAYSPDGSFLARLQGTIDMANLAGHVLEPADPKFDDTLMTITHEFLHRWGAYVHFRDGAGESDALQGLDGAHWSFLLDSEGSTLYGNNWLDNSDGTFTTIAPKQASNGEVIGRIFSPLDLYLIGLIDKSRVPQMLLIDAPGLDPAQLPGIGVTIPGVAKTVTIDDIIAVEGERIPAAADSRKEFRVAFIYAVAPGTWSASAPQARGQVAAINQLQNEWEKRFSILTDGAALMSTAFVTPEVVESNPVVTPPPFIPAQMQSVNNGVAWLVSRQGQDGSWQDQPGTNRRDTAAAVVALKVFPAGSTSVVNGQLWLGTAAPENNDFLARKLLSLDNVSVTELTSLQNADGGWGSAHGYGSDPVDTALVLRTLTARNAVDHNVALAAINYLHSAQLPDGGWNSGSGGSLVQPAAQALLSLNSFRGSYPLEPVIADGLAWLTARQNSDGGFGNSPSTVIDTAAALQALKATGASAAAVNGAVNYLLGRQADTGSWNDSVFQTAQAIEALYAGQVAADLAVETADISFNPVTAAAVPSTVAVSVTVRNLGSNAVSQVRVALFAGDPALGVLVGEQLVNVAGNGSALASFSVMVNETGLHDYYATVDGDNRIAEANEWNNSAFKTLTANLPPPTVGFDLAASAGAEEQASVSLAIRLSYPWPEPITVNYTINSATTAVSSVDYVMTTGTLTFAADQTDRTIDLTVVNDLAAEPDESVIIDLAAPSLGALGASRHTYTILDDEAPAVSITSPPGDLIGQNSPQLLYSTTGGNVVVMVDGLAVSKASGSSLDALADGPHSVEVTACNSSGLTTTARVDFIVDTALPTVTIRSPLPGIVTNPRPLLDYTVTSAVRLEILVDGIAASQVAGGQLGPLADGTHTLTINAWNAGGAKRSSQVVFPVDARPPLVKILYPANEFIRETNPVLLSRIDEAGRAVVWLDGIETAFSVGEGIGPLGSGVHRLRVMVTDAVGNIGSDEVIFAVAAGEEAAFVLADGWPARVEGTYGGIAVDRSGNPCVVTRRTAKEFDIIKYDPAGRQLWRAIRSSYFNVAGSHWVDIEPKDVAIDSLGNIYIVGWGYSNSCNYSVLAKYDAKGNYVSHLLFDTRMLYGDVEIHSVHVDGNDLVYVAGNTENDLFAVDYSQPATMFVAKYDNNLRRLYGVCYGDAYDPANFHFASRDSLAVDDNQNVFVTGRNGSNRLLLWKLGQDLTRTGVEIVGADNTSGLDVAVDLFGDVYVAGAGPSGGAVWKYSADGQLVAMQDEGFPSRLPSLVVNKDGTVFVADDAGTVRKLDERFAELWSIHLGGDFDSKIVLASTGQLLIGGSDDSLKVASVAGMSDPRTPQFSFSQPVFYANDALVVLSGYLEPGFDVVLEGGGPGSGEYSHETDSGRWQMVVNGLSAGEHLIAVSVTNDTGFAKHYTTRVVVDTIAPQVEIDIPANGSVWASRPCLSYTVNEGEVRVFINGIDVTKRSGSQIDSLRPGENRIRVQSTDPSGNVGFDDIVIQAASAAVGEYPLDVENMRKVGIAGNQTVIDSGQDGAGNLYVFGETFLETAGYVYRELYVAKFDPAGNLLKFWQLGGSSNFDYGAALAVTASGAFTIACNTHLSDNLYTTYMGIASYSANGTLLWSDELSSGAVDEIHDLAVDAAGNIYACGYTTGRLNNKRYGGKEDYFLIKYSPQGGRLWTVLSNAPTSDILKDIKLSDDGFLYGMGRMTDVTAMTLFKFDLNGVLLWKKDYQYPDSLMRAEQMEVGGDGSFYTFIESQTSISDDYYYVTKHDRQGNFVTGIYGRAPSIRGMGLSLDAGSNVYVTGYADDPYGWGWSLDGNRSFGDEDIFIAKYAAADLHALWTRQIGDAKGQQGSSIIFSRVGGQAYLAGIADGDFAGAESNGRDIFLAPLMQLAETPAPVLTITDYRSPARLRYQVVHGHATPGAILGVAVTAPAASSAEISPPAQYPDGSWSFTVSDLVANTDNVLTIEAADAFGTVSQAMTITVDDLPPFLSIDPVDSTVSLPTQSIAGQIEDGAILTMAGMPGTIPASNGTWSHAVEHLREGDNYFTFTATDTVGNQTVKSATITYVPPPPPTLVVEPAVIMADESADITLKIGNVSPAGATLILTKILDLDRNGRADAGEPVVRRGSVTDGGTHRNLNIVSDADGSVDGRIIAHVNYRFVNDRYHAAGQYVWTVETATGSDSEAFGVIEATLSQRLDGVVQDGQGVPLGGALVELRDPWERSHGFAVTDAAGRYRFNVRQPGDYLPVPLAEGYVFDRGAASLATVAIGQAVTRDLVLLAGGRQVGGTVGDAASLLGLPGVMVNAENDRYLSATMTAADGSYRLRLPDGDYNLWVETRPGDGLAAHGYPGSPKPQLSVTVNGDLAGRELLVHPGTTLACGMVTTVTGAGLAGVPIRSIRAEVPEVLSEAVSDGSGNYCLALDSLGGWQVALSDRFAPGSGLVGTMTTAAGPNLTAYPVDAWINGTVRNIVGQPVDGVVVEASHAAGAGAAVATTADGRYLLGVSTEPAGDWMIAVYGEDDGFASVVPVAISTTQGRTITQNFTIGPAFVNTIVVTKAVYDARKKVLNVEATSNNKDAALQVVGYGPMMFSRLSKERYYWSFSRSVASRPATVTVAGPEGSRTATVQ
ncbi:MAG: SBBP repeat-containing protein [Desulfuromonadales bacterium]|nr:SBBP repeat-containing protein [Desulfuromonadales bacterium]